MAHGYGAGQKPEDFLDGFTAFVRDNVNKIAALTSWCSVRAISRVPS